MDEDNQHETFRPTSGRVLGVVGIVISLAVVVIGVVDRGAGIAWWAVALAVFFAVLSWAALLRPLVSVAGDTLVLRNVVSDVRIPLAAIEEVVVRQVLVVRAGPKRYTSPAVGRSRRQITRDDRRAGRDTGGTVDVSMLAADSYGLFVEERLRGLATNARDRQGIRVYSPEQEALAGQVERTPAVPEIAGLVGSALAYVVLAAL